MFNTLNTCHGNKNTIYRWLYYTISKLQTTIAYSHGNNNIPSSCCITCTAPSNEINERNDILIFNNTARFARKKNDQVTEL